MMKIMTEITGVGRVSSFSSLSLFLFLFPFLVCEGGREEGWEEEEVKVDYLIEEFLRARLEAR